MKKLSPTFCIYPFTHLATKTDGTLKLCCRSEPITNIEKQSALEAWNGEDFKRIRLQMLKGERPPECANCWRMEDVGARSMRMRALRDFPGSRWNRYGKSLDALAEDGTLTVYPKSLELKISNLCNLKCRMCHPLDSTSWNSDWWEVEDLMETHNKRSYERARSMNLKSRSKVAAFENCDSWWKEFETLVDHVDLIEFAGGEPLIDPSHYRILDLLQRRAGEIRLKYSTNLTHLRFKGTHIFEHWKNFAGVSVYASIDGIGDVYEYIRTGANFQEVSGNLKALTESTAVRFEDIAVACTIQIYNAFQLPEIAAYFSKMGVKFHTHRVSYPEFLNVQILPPSIKARLTEEIKIFQQRKITSDFEETMFRHINQHLQDHVNFMNGRDESHLLPAFAEFTRRMDRLRGTNAANLHPSMGALLSPDDHGAWNDREPDFPTACLGEKGP